MARLRTFIAIDLGKPVRDRVHALQELLAKSTSDVKWVEYDNLHISLLFLGEVEDREVPAVCRVVGDVALEQAAFALTIETAGCFPNPRRPRVLWIGVGQGTQQVVALHDALEPRLEELGCYRREERRYTPHVTLGRVKGNRPPDNLAAALLKHAAWNAGETTVGALHVMSSELTSQGPVYTVLSRAKLAQSPQE
jgi:2'-5' RNA ligase